LRNCLSNFDFKFNLRNYNLECGTDGEARTMFVEKFTVRRCRLTL